jgi:hypothetical protein
MHDIGLVLLGLIIGIGLSIVVTALRRSSVTDLGAPGHSEIAPHLDSSAPSAHGLHVTKTIKSRVEARVTPDGLSAVVDGRTYHDIDDIPDPAIREVVRQTLSSLPATVSDPAMRSRVEKELEDAGLHPTTTPTSAPAAAIPAQSTEAGSVDHP